MRNTYRYCACRIKSWQQETSNATTGTLFGYEHNLSDELVRSEKVNLATSTLLDRETWGLDKGGAKWGQGATF